MAIRPKSIVPKVGEPDIDESYIRQQDVVVLKTLLIDRTMTALNGGTPVNIKWAVDDYAKEYPNRSGYGCEDAITIDAISRGDGKDLKVVTPRVKKRKEEQERRTAQRAEVFTPSWICNEQNNLVDEAWFGRKDNLFNKLNIKCEGCVKNDVKLHDGVRCRVMDWEIGRPVLFMPPFEYKPIEAIFEIRGGRNDIAR